MAYSAEISRENPSCFVFLIDQSTSMEDPLGSSLAGGERGQGSKADAVADAINKLLHSLVLRCAKSEGVRDYYHVGVIGYGARVGSAFGGALAGQQLAPISAIANMPARVEERTKKEPDGAGGLVSKTVKFPIWFDPMHHGGTPMCEAFQVAQGIVAGWLSAHGACFPPIVINITDGESTDGDPTALAQRIQDLASSDGHVLLFNLHLSGDRSAPVVFPDDGTRLPDDYARMLHGMSSTLPESVLKSAQQEGFRVSSSTRGFAFNADLVSVIQFLEIGTRQDLR